MIPFDTIQEFFPVLRGDHHLSAFEFCPAWAKPLCNNPDEPLAGWTSYAFVLDGEQYLLRVQDSDSGLEAECRDFLCLDRIYSDCHSGIPVSIEARRDRFAIRERGTGRDLFAFIPGLSRYHPRFSEEALGQAALQHALPDSALPGRSRIARI
jgi:hypothetical protein